jgi:hypothetical protein
MSTSTLENFPDTVFYYIFYLLEIKSPHITSFNYLFAYQKSLHKFCNDQIMVSIRDSLSVMLDNKYTIWMPCSNKE